MKAAEEDFFGRPIKVGDFFTMAYRDGNSAEAGAGRVIEIGAAGGIKAWVAKRHWSAKIQLNSKPSNLGALDRLIVVTPDSIPESVRQALEAAQ